MARLWGFVFGVSVALFASSFVAQSAYAEQSEPASYRATIEQGLAEYGERNYEEASTLFSRAHELFPNARTLRGMGMAAFELRRYEESIGHLEASLSSKVKPLEGELRKETESLLARARGFVATVKVELEPESAQLKLDGGDVAMRGPLLLRLGEHVLEAHAEGYLSERKSLRVRGGELLDLKFALSADPTSPLGKPAEKPRRLYKNPWLWTAVGVVVAGAAAGITVWAIKKNDGSDRSVGLNSGKPAKP